MPKITSRHWGALIAFLTTLAAWNLIPAKMAGITVAILSGLSAFWQAPVNKQ